MFPTIVFLSISLAVSLSPSVCFCRSASCSSWVLCLSPPYPIHSILLPPIFLHSLPVTESYLLHLPCSRAWVFSLTRIFTHSLLCVLSSFNFSSGVLVQKDACNSAVVKKVWVFSFMAFTCVLCFGGPLCPQSHRHTVLGFLSTFVYGVR